MDRLLPDKLAQVHQVLVPDPTARRRRLPTLLGRHLTQPRWIFCVQGVVSPWLANIYLYCVLDLWAHRGRRKQAFGEVILVRYGDDFVMEFSASSESEAFPGGVVFFLSLDPRSQARDVWNQEEEFSPLFPARLELWGSILGFRLRSAAKSCYTKGVGPRGKACTSGRIVAGDVLCPPADIGDLSAKRLFACRATSMQTAAPDSLQVIETLTFVDCPSPAMRAIQSLILQIAPTDIPVLLTGETGTGKEVVALQLHHQSVRRGGPFLKVRCSSLTPEAIERAFEGVREGEGDSLAWGTLLFDEIGELDPDGQSKLLQALSAQDSVRARPRPGTCFVSTTCRNLDEEARTGRFRDELYYRISGVSLRLPPLRQRREDIPVLADFFAKKFASLFGRLAPVLSGRALELLQTYEWPGNVRELENTVRKVVALGDERLALEDLEGSLGSRLPARSESPAQYSLKDAGRAASRQAERELILKVLGHTRWNRKRAAEKLHISYKALLYKLKQIGVDN